VLNCLALKLGTFKLFLNCQLPFFLCHFQKIQETCIKKSFDAWLPCLGLGGAVSQPLSDQICSRPRTCAFDAMQGGRGQQKAEGPRQATIVGRLAFAKNGVWHHMADATAAF
jgi:hypothetical protein